MIGFLIRWITNTLALIIAVGIVPGIQVDRWETVAVAALILGMLNASLRPLLILLTLPLHFISLGFFTLLINGFMLYLVAKVVAGFKITGFWDAFWGALFFSIVSFLLNLFVDPGGKVKVSFTQRPLKGFQDGDVIDVEGKTSDGRDSDKQITGGR